MKAIYASKLYKASKRKSKIAAALADPINIELVKQLNTYLDPEYQTPENLDPDGTDKIDDADSDGANIVPSEGGASLSGGGSTLPEDNGPDLSDMAQEVDSERAEMLDTSDSDESNVEESIRISGDVITTTHNILDDRIDSIVRDSDAIKGLLNSRADSTGVVKIGIEDGELWVYFGEDVNLNEVMEPAISALNAGGYSSLNFKKLLRSDNAMTFEISETASEMQPIDSK